MKCKGILKEYKMKKILLIATGGTIASKPTENGLVPSITSEEILAFLPQIGEICQVEAIQLMNIDSSNMSPSGWLKIARTIEAHYDSFDGFVITHGTDTLAYTAAAMSYLIQNSRKPIVLTGSQKSIYLRDTDARKNLTDAFRFACDEYAQGVHIVFDSKIILGTRGRKTKTHSYNAFDSVDFPQIGQIFDEKIIYYIKERTEKDTVFYHELNDRVCILKLVPGLSPEILKFMGDNSDVVIIEGFGTGGIPAFDESERLREIVKELRDKGKFVILTTSVPHEGSNTQVYQVGNEISETLDLMENYNMTIESTVCKMMWLTAITQEYDEVKAGFYSPVAHDLLL